MLPSFWRAKSEPGKDAGSVRTDLKYGRDRGRKRGDALQPPRSRQAFAGGALLGSGLVQDGAERVHLTVPEEAVVALVTLAPRVGIAGFRLGGFLQGRPYETRAKVSLFGRGG